MIFYVGDVSYVKTKFTGVDGKTKVGWAEDGSDFELRADQTGIYFKGTMKAPISGMVMLQDFAQLVTEAWKEHGRLAPKLITKVTELNETSLG